MIKTVKAKIRKNGKVELLEPVYLTEDKDALLTIIETDEFENESALLSEKSLAEDWNSKADSRWDEI